MATQLKLFVKYNIYRKIFKRALDIMLSLIGLCLLVPVFIIIVAFSMYFLSGKPFYTQSRVGLNGRIFKLIKFRSMNEARGSDGELKKDTDRLIPYGRFLRKYSLDELPQLYNVLIGDMSLVGPRPLLPEYLPYYSSYHSRRHNVRPGITGLAQVSGRNILLFSERLNYDVKYVENVSIIGDCKILYKTFIKIFRNKEIIIGRQLSEVDDIGLSQGLRNKSNK